MSYIDPTTAYVAAVKQWTRTQPVEALCRELGVYPRQLQDFLNADDPDPGLVVRLGAMMDGTQSSLATLELPGDVRKRAASNG